VIFSPAFCIFENRFSNKNISDQHDATDAGILIGFITGLAHLSVLYGVLIRKLKGIEKPKLFPRA